MVSSFFDVFTELSLDGGQTWSPAVGDPARIESRPDPDLVPAISVPTRLQPPPNDVYVATGGVAWSFANGVVIRAARQWLFDGAAMPPSPGDSPAMHTYNSYMDMMVSTDGGQTFLPVRVPAPVGVLAGRLTAGAVEVFDTEMLSLDISGALPGGMMIRASPTLPSRGQTAMRADAAGGVRISSFFDIFTELSLDGGQTWMPDASGPGRLELQSVAPEDSFTSTNLPPPSGVYTCPQPVPALFANGAILGNFLLRNFTQSFPAPAPGAAETHACDATVDLTLSVDGGTTFSPAMVPANVAFHIASAGDSGDTRYFDTEMLSLSISGGSLPAEIMIRESPSRASLGRTSQRTLPGGPVAVDSFFDIFTELSTDGGQTWLPAVLTMTWTDGGSAGSMTRRAARCFRRAGRS